MGKGRGGVTVEYPRGFMDENDAERFGVIGFEAFDHEFDGAVVLGC